MMNDATKTPLTSEPIKSEPPAARRESLSEGIPVASPPLLYDSTATKPADNREVGTLVTISSQQSDSFLTSSDDEFDELAFEVGLSAECYLEECFRTEVNVLDREKFNSVPQLSKHDFAISKHLGKGSFSDVFEIVCETQHDNEVSSRLLNTLGVDNSSAIAAGEERRVFPKRKEDSIRRCPLARRASLASFLTTATSTLTSPNDTLILAMKCLRPQIRSDAHQFAIGAEDLVHETALLASLDHPNIIKVHGRASGSLSDAFILNDGYFILLDRLSETLTERINTLWKSGLGDGKKGPGISELKIAQDIARAVSYLHSKQIVFRDLKPDNVGFDSNGVLKLFDFGLALGLPEKTKENPSGLLYDRVGTMRYMAPEVGLDTIGHGRPADVYSFGLLLWQLCSKETPFFEIQTTEEFERRVFIRGTRPALNVHHWPGLVCSLIKCCWEDAPKRRPTMKNVRSTLNDILQSFSEPAVSVKSRPRIDCTNLSVTLHNPRADYIGLLKKLTR